MNYYDQELAVINKPGEIVKVKFTGLNLNGEDAGTKWMNLNKESIDAIRRFLDTIESELEEQ